MKRTELEAKASGREDLFAISDVRLLSAQETAETSPFAHLGYKPDNSKAYVQFRVNHSMPVVAGPLVSGNYTSYHPKVIGRSYQSFLHQQMNLRHLVRSYNPKVIAKDRIVGAVVAVKYPENVTRVPATKEEAVPITALAAIFKQADGVPKMLGDHLGNRQEWSVSIEMIYQISECGIFLQSDGSITPIMEAPEKMWAGISRSRNGLRVGKLGGKETGEQMVIAPGCIENAIEYQGAGFTPTPAEWEAEIDSIQAERAEKLPDGVVAIAAEKVPMAMFPRGVWWRDASQNRTVARVLEVHEEGAVKLGADKREATPENPILHCRTRGGLELLRSLKSIRF